jgi:hypothetical protein
MSDPSSKRDSQRRPIPVGLLGMLALVVAVEAWILKHEAASFTTGTALSWKQAMRATRREARRSDVLCFGDSMVKFGLAPPIVSGRSGRSAYNLAVWGGPPSMSYLLFRRTLDAGARPKALIVNFMPHLLKESPQFHLRHWREVVGPREFLDLARSTRDPSFLLAIAIGRVVPSIRDRYEIRASVDAALKGMSTTAWITDFVTPLNRNWRQNRGGQVMAKKPEFDGAANPNDRALFPDASYRVDPISARYMRRFLDLARDHHATVYWLLPPLCPSTQELREKIGADASYAKMVRTVQARYPNVKVLDARHSIYPANVFNDPVHMDWQGASALSLAVADLLRNHQGDGRRWIDLPVYQDPVVNIRLEDFDASRLAVKSDPKQRH